MGVFGKGNRSCIASIATLPKVRSNPQNGVRWSLVYKEEYNRLGASKAPHSDAWPEFMGQNNEPIVGEIIMGQTYLAYLHIFEHMIEYHSKRMREGTEFYCMEGSLIVAYGTVTCPPSDYIGSKLSDK